MSWLVLAVIAALTPGLYSGATRQPHGLIQLEVGANGKGRFRQVISIHLPPAEIESIDVTLTVTKDTVCLSPAPGAIEKCLRRTKDGLVAVLSENNAELLLVFRPPADAGR
jgi:hypothetical protein